MSSVKKYPFLSLIIVLVAYGTIGWVLRANTAKWGFCTGEIGSFSFPFNCQIWVLALVIGLILLLAETLASPFSNIRRFLSLSFQSDARAFILLVSLAFLTSFMIIWIHVVSYLLIIMAASLLARLDLMTTGFKDWQAFFILAAFSLAGFGLGWLGNNFITA